MLGSTALCKAVVHLEGGEEEEGGGRGREGGGGGGGGGGEGEGGGGGGGVPPLNQISPLLEIASLQSFDTKSLRIHQKQSQTV